MPDLVPHSPLRVLHIVTELSKGGGFVSPMEFAKNAADETGQVHEFLAIEPGSTVGIPIASSIIVHQNRARSYAECAAWISRMRYDVLHWHWWSMSGPMTLLMAEMALVGGHKRIITCDVFPVSSRYRLGRREIAYADMIVFDGRDTYDSYSEIPLSQKEFVVGATNLTTYQRVHARSDDGKFRIGRGSYLHPLKCPTDLIADIRGIMTEIPNAEFHIFGHGPLEQRMRKEIARYGLGCRVLMRGWVSDFASEVAKLDLYYYPMPKESYASSELNLQGVMAAEVPLVIIPSDGVKWMFKHGVDALVAQNRKESLAFCKRLATDPVERIRLAEGGRAKALAEFGVHNMVRGYLNRVYPQCVARHPASGRVEFVSSANSVRFPERLEMAARSLRSTTQALVKKCASIGFRR